MKLFAQHKHGCFAQSCRRGSMSSASAHRLRRKEQIFRNFHAGFSRDILEIFFSFRQIFYRSGSMVKIVILPVSTQSIVALNSPSKLPAGFRSSLHALFYSGLFILHQKLKILVRLAIKLRREH